MRHLPTVSDENLQCPAESKRCLRRNWSFLCSVISQGKVVALDRWGGQWNQLSMTHRLTTNCAKNYCNRTLIVKVIVENVVTCFLGHGVVVGSVNNSVFSSRRNEYGRWQLHSSTNGEFRMDGPATVKLRAPYYSELSLRYDTIRYDRRV